MYVFVALFYQYRFYAIVCHVMLRLCMACSSLAAAPAKLLHLIESLTLRWKRAKVSALRKTAPCEYLSRFVISDTLSRADGCRVDRCSYTVHLAIPWIAVEANANCKKCPTKEATRTYRIYQITATPSAPTCHVMESCSFGDPCRILHASNQLFTHREYRP